MQNRAYSWAHDDGVWLKVLVFLHARNVGILLYYILVVDCHIKVQFNLTHDDTMHMDMYLLIELHMCYRIQYLKLVLLKIAFINVNKVRQ